MNNELDEIQNYVINNRISSLSELKQNNTSLYRKYLKLRESNNDLVIRFDKCIVESKQEEYVIKKLLYYSVSPENISTGFYFPNFIKRSRPYRYDILLIKEKIFIEVNGKQHFDKEITKSYWKDVEYDDNVDVQESDKIKKEFAESNGYKVMYFTIYKDVYNKYGYFDKVYTNIEDLLTSVGIPLTINKNYLLDLENFKIKNTKDKTSEELTKIIQDFINENKIKNPIELKKKKSVYLNYVYEYNLRDKIRFHNDKPYNYRNIKSINDINKLLRDNGVVTLTQFRNSKFRSLRSTMKYKKWKNSDLYFNNDLTIEDVIGSFKIFKIRNQDELLKTQLALYIKCKNNNWFDKLKYYSDNN